MYSVGKRQHSYTRNKQWRCIYANSCPFTSSALQIFRPTMTVRISHLLHQCYVTSSSQSDFVIIPSILLRVCYKFKLCQAVFPCFFLSCKANARVKLAKTGHGPHSSKLVVIWLFCYYLCCSTWCGRKMRLATLCTNRQCCCLPLHTAVRLTPAVDSVQV